MGTKTDARIDTIERTLADLSTAVSTIANGLGALLEAKAEPKAAPSVAIVNPEGTVKVVDNPSDDDVKAYVKSLGWEIRGKVTPERHDKWLAKYRADHAEAVEKIEQRAHPAAVGSSIFGTYTAPSAERRYGRPTAREAAEAIMTDPDLAAAMALKPGDWLALSQHGAGHKTDRNTGVVLRKGKPNPTNLDGNDRRICHFMAAGKIVGRDGSESELTPSVKLVACNIIRKARAAGFAV